MVAVMALLASLAASGLRQSMQAARSVKCRSNLRQMSVAAQLYAAGNRDYFPIAYYTQNSPVFTSFCWDFTTSKDWATRPPQVRTVPGLLWEDPAAAEIQQCPAFRGPANWLADSHTGYNYNTSYIGHGSGEAIPEPARTSAVRRPAGTALFGDGEYSGGANKFMRAPWSNPGDAQFAGRYAGTQGFRHSGRTNVAFCDGHAEAWSRRCTSTYPDDQARIAAGTGFLSDDNSLYDLE